MQPLCKIPHKVHIQARIITYPLPQ